MPEIRLKYSTKSASDNSAAPNPPRFQFIHSTPTAKGRVVGNSSTVVRKHVMRDIGKARRRTRVEDADVGVGSTGAGPEGGVELQDADKRGSTSKSGSNALVTTIVGLGDLSLPSPVSLLGAATHIDPFNAYPIRMDRGSFELVDYGKPIFGCW